MGYFMDVFERLTPQEISQEARALFAEERTRKVLNSWFRTREIADAAGQDESFPELRAAAQLEAIVEGLPLDITLTPSSPAPSGTPLPPATR